MANDYETWLTFCRVTTGEKGKLSPNQNINIFLINIQTFYFITTKSLNV